VRSETSECCDRDKWSDVRESLRGRSDEAFSLHFRGVGRRSRASGPRRTGRPMGWKTLSSVLSYCQKQMPCWFSIFINMNPHLFGFSCFRMSFFSVIAKLFSRTARQRYAEVSCMVGRHENLIQHCNNSNYQLQDQVRCWNRVSGPVSSWVQL